MFVLDLMQDKKRITNYQIRICSEKSRDYRLRSFELKKN